MKTRRFGLFVPALVAGFLLAGLGTGARAQSCSGTPNQNTICAGPSSGGSGFPNFRAMVPADVPASGVLDVIGSTRGSVLERGASGWQIITPGTSGLPWVSNGAGADPGYQALTNAGLANMTANTVKCNNTGSPAAPIDCTATQTNNLLSAAPWNDTSTVLASPAAFWNPSYFGNPGTGIVDLFNRVFIGAATQVSKDVRASPLLPTTPGWLDSLVNVNIVGASQLASGSAIGDLGVTGYARTSDFRQWAGSASGGSQGITGFSVNDDGNTSAASATVTAGGSGYTNGTQTLQVLGGTCVTQPFFSVTVTGGVVGGTPTLVNGGDCSVTPANPAATSSGGSGSGATLTVTYATGNPIATNLFAAVHKSGVTAGISVGAQMDMNSALTVVDVTPNGGVVGGSTFAGLFTSGSYSAVGTQKISAFAAFGAGRTGGPTARKGLVFFNGGLDTTVGNSGGGTAIEFGDKNEMRWLTNAGAMIAEIYGTSTLNGIIFNAGNIQFLQNFTANGAGAAVTFGATTPAAITTPATVAKWFTVVDNVGNIDYIPAWH